VSGPKGWPPLRQHGRHCATPPVIKETDLSSSLAASLPGPMPSGPIAIAMEESGPIVRCGNCNAIGYASQIPEIPTRGPRCADIDACTDRWFRGMPVSLLPPGASLSGLLPVAEPAPQPEPEDVPPELPPAQEAALIRFNAATDEQDAAERAPGEAEAGEPAEPVTEDAAPAQDDTPAPVAGRRLTDVEAGAITAQQVALSSDQGLERCPHEASCPAGPDPHDLGDACLPEPAPPVAEGSAPADDDPAEDQ